MKRYGKIMTGVAVAAAVSLAPLAAQADEASIAEVAAEAGDFTTLLAAVTEAGLAETLSDCAAGPFTVFAPTDDAFADLIAAGVDIAAIIGDSELLTNILTYHVADGVVDSTTVVGLDTAEMLNGDSVTINVDGDTVTLNEDVTVTAVDIEACNGIIHVIDGVLVPPGADVPMVEADDAAADDAEETVIVAVGSNSALLAALAAGLLLAGAALLIGGRRRLMS
jgi:uncharacterized surface protein with fasciclin (FAS1) repeats